MFEKSNSTVPEIGWGSESERKKQLQDLRPNDENGVREQAVLIGYVPDINNEADFAINMLSAYGIPVFKNYNNEGSLGKLIIGTSAYSVALYAPASMVEDAKALLETPAENIEEEFANFEHP